MEKVIALVSANPTKSRIHGGNSTSDRLSSTYTVCMLMAFACFIQFGHLFGDPVQCWCPAHFTGTHSAYTNTVCWTRNTYYLPHTEEIPKEGVHREYISYYQWVALVLTFQALAFLAPKALWKSLSSLAGVAVPTITDVAINCDNATSQADRDKSLSYMVEHLHRFLSKLGSTCCGILQGHYLPTAYLFVKIIYFVNVVSQLYVLNKFLGTDYNLYGIEILGKMARGESWINSTRFPRVTLCDFKIRLLGNVHRYTVQCSLPMNLFNEIIYIFIWFWFVFVAAMTAGSLFSWLLVSIVPYFNRRFVKKRLLAMNKIKDDDKYKNDLKTFSTKYLKGDGCFLLRMISKNASDLVAAEVIAGLWDKFQTQRNNIPGLTNGDSEHTNVVDKKTSNDV